MVGHPDLSRLADTVPGGSAGPNPRAFGHGGAGGSYAFADPENRVSYAYVMNKFVTGSTGADQRSDSLVRALYAALQERA